MLPHSPSRHSAPRATSDDRSMNIVMFGVAEDRNASVWRKKVENALGFISGHEMDIVDMFRAGRYTASKTRPIIIKLRTVWDKRIILVKRKRLYEYEESGGESGIFVSADESLEVRRKQTIERLKSKAERDGKSAVINGDVLVVDGVRVFSMKDGKLNSDA